MFSAVRITQPGGPHAVLGPQVGYLYSGGTEEYTKLSQANSLLLEIRTCVTENRGVSGS
jgi:hypothetical protein